MRPFSRCQCLTISCAVFLLLTSHPVSAQTGTSHPSSPFLRINLENLPPLAHTSNTFEPQDEAELKERLRQVAEMAARQDAEYMERYPELFGISGGFDWGTYGQPDGGLPLPGGTPFTAFNGRPSQTVPTIFLGPHAAFFDAFMRAKAIALLNIVPLDVYSGDPFDPAGGAAFGGYYERPVRRSIYFRGAVDFFGGSGFKSPFEDDVFATLASVEEAWDAVLQGQSGANTTTSSTIESNPGLWMSGTAGVAFKPSNHRILGFFPAVHGAVGVTRALGSEMSAELVADSSFSLGGSFFRQVDRLTVTGDVSPGLTIEAALNLTKPLSERTRLRWGLRARGVRVNRKIHVTTNPQHDTSSPLGIAVFATEPPTAPTWQFSKVPGVPSSLDGNLDTATYDATSFEWGVVVEAGIGFGR